MVCSRCLGHRPPPESQSGKSPSFIAAFHGGTPPFGRSHSGFWVYTEFSEAERTTRGNKTAAPIKRFNFLRIYTTLVILMSISNALTDLHT